MDFIALTLEQAREKAKNMGLDLELEYIENEKPLQFKGWRVVKQLKENGVITLYLMVEV